MKRDIILGDYPNLGERDDVNQINYVYQNLEELTKRGDSIWDKVGELMA